MMDIHVLKRVCISTRARHDAIASGASEDIANKAYESVLSGTGIEFSEATSIAQLTFNRELNDLLYDYFKKVDSYEYFKKANDAAKATQALAEMKEAYDMFQTFRAMSTETELLIFPIYQS